MLEATLRDRARSLLTASGRSDVPPFMVMDVMAAAARIEAAGGHVIHMEVGQPCGAGAEGRDSGRARRARRRADRLYLRARHSLAARAHRPALPRDLRLRGGSRRGSWSRRARRARFILAFLAMFEPGDRVAVTVPGYPPYRHILTALGCEPVLIETSSETRHALTGEALLAAHRKTPLKGVLVGSPANPTGTMMSQGGAHRPDRGGGRRRHSFHFRRDLPWPRLCISRGDGGGALAACAGHQFVLEIFLHDRLAGRLDGGAGAAGAADRTAAAESRDLGADAVADCRRGGVRGPRRRWKR